jgi:hypothetical protein
MSDAMDKLNAQFSADINRAQDEYFQKLAPLDSAFLTGQIGEAECQAKRPDFGGLQKMR